MYVSLLNSTTNLSLSRMISSFEYLKAHGFKNVKVTPATNDGGKDIIAKKNGYKYVIECKKYKGCVGRPVVQKIHSAAIISGATGMIMTTGYYSKQAIIYAKKRGVILIDRGELGKFNKSLKRKSPKTLNV